MSLDLPPRRPLPDPDRMLREILAAGDGADSNSMSTGPARHVRRHRPVVAGVLVAAAALGATAVAVPMVLQRSGTVTASPGPTVVPSAAVHPTPVHPTPVHPTPGRLALGTTADLSYLTVRVDKVEHSPAFGIVADVGVCVRSLPAGSTATTFRVSWSQWSLVSGPIRTPAELRPVVGPPLTKAFPDGRDVPVGRCVTGRIPFNADEHSAVAEIRYQDAFGGTARWSGR